MARRSGAAVAALGKREAILTAAQEVFLEQGYAAASVDSIAARAGVSKATIYAHFKSKRELFETLIRGRCESCFGVIELPDVNRQGLKEALVTVARNFLALMMSPEAVAMFRVVVAEGPRQPEVSEAFYAAGPSPGLQRVARFLEDVAQRGLLEVPDPKLAAEFFIGMLKGDFYLKALLGLPLDGYAPDEIAEQAAEAFIRAYAPAGEGRG